MKHNITEFIDISRDLEHVGITSDNFISDGHFLELILLSSVRSDGLSNLGYGFTEVYIAQMGACSINVAFGYVQISKELATYFGLESNFLKLNEIKFQFPQLSLLTNLLLLKGIKVLNVKAFGVNIFVDISPSVSFTINRIQKYIRNLKESLYKTLQGEVVHMKGKSFEVNIDSPENVSEKIDSLNELYGGSNVHNYYGNVNMHIGMGLNNGINFYYTESEYIHSETEIYMSEYGRQFKDFGVIRVSVPNLSYDTLLSIDCLKGYEENEQSLLELHDDIRAGYNFIFGVLDAWCSLRNNRKSVFG